MGQMEQLEILSGQGSAGARILGLRGPLTLKTLFDFQDMVRKDQSPRLILDLSEVSYMDSAGLGALGAYASCQKTGRQFAVAGVSERVLTLFRMTRVEDVVPRYESAIEAEAHFVNSAS